MRGIGDLCELECHVAGSGEGNLQYSCMNVCESAINKSRNGFCKQNKLS